MTRENIKWIILIAPFAIIAIAAALAFVWLLWGRVFGEYANWVTRTGVFLFLWAIGAGIWISNEEMKS